MSSIEQVGAWPARVAWVVLALVAGGCVGDALDGRTSAVRVVVVVGLWLGWGASLVALLVPRTTSLTALRVLVPTGLAAVLAAVAAGDVLDASDLAAVAAASVTTAAVLMPWVGEAWVDGSAYGPEQRLPLRPPVVVAYLLAPITWAVVALGAVAGPLLLAAGAWLAGAIALVVGWAAVVAGMRSLHQLARRWVVLVPAGVVVHDPLTMPEPQLFLRRSIMRFGPAEVGSDAHDLTAGAAGLALELVLDEPVELLVRVARGTTETIAVTAVLVTPTRPGRVLAGAREHRVPVA